MKNNLLSWLENPSIKKVLNEVLDKLDIKPFSLRKNNISILVNEKNFIELYEPSEDGNDVFLEKDIKCLEEVGVFSFSKSIKKYLCLNEQNIKLIFNKEYEEEIRIQYKRVKNIDTWENALLKFNFEDKLFEILKTTPLVITSKSNIEVLEKFDTWLKSEKRSTSIRQESARCFWGLSKVFDKKYELCKYLCLKEKPILLQVHIKKLSSKKVLFIENLETFVSCMESSNKIFDEFILIYSSGYKASAQRIRQKDGSKIFFSNSNTLEINEKEEFLSWFYSFDNEKIQLYFWGDLDYSGISILSSLKKNFTNLIAWENAYSLMLKELENKNGHSFEMAGKEKQKEITSSGCKYSDEVLLPMIKERKMFLDQESIILDSL